MKIVFHVGMGKTGTSSIQSALFTNESRLLEQNIRYLGMWFDIIGPAFQGAAGNVDFFRKSPEDMQKCARLFLERIQADSVSIGCDYYIISNEEIYGQVMAIMPFIKELEKHISVRIVCYIRDPYDWLPSAYNQWSIFHKTYDGPILPYGKFARKLIKTFHGLLIWKKEFPNTFDLRIYKKLTNVVEDFSHFLDLDLEIPTSRVLARTELSESVLRAVFNSQRPSATLPADFDSAFRGVNFNNSINIENLIRQSFDYDETDKIIRENSGLFRSIEEIFNIDLALDNARSKEGDQVNVDDLRNRMLEHVLQIVIFQADRIGELEKKMRRLEDR